MTSSNLLHARGLTQHTPAGRMLFRDLTLILERGDKVAVVGRNGVGKSTLLQVLAGERGADSGEVIGWGERLLVPQGVAPNASGSPGEVRRRRLQSALDAQPDLLLLDEPTHDLDQAGLDWLAASLRDWRRGLLVVTHDRRLLREFRDFFVVAESGCRHVSGSWKELLVELSRAQADNERRYLSELERLTAREQRQFLVHQRRQRKKNVGRVRELARGTPRIRLNAKRSSAQEKQGKRNLIQQDRIEKAREFTEAARRTLAVELPLLSVLPQLPEPSLQPIVHVQHVSARSGDRTLFEDLSFDVNRQRLAVRGPNGSGKSTLLELLAGVRQPLRGRVQSESNRIGYVAQNAANWCLEESLVHQLIHELHATPLAAAGSIRAHGFPFALADRPLASLSPGERLRAALICLLQRPEPPELLILDEPTSHLDFLGHDALQKLLASWRGGLVVASHDEDFVRAVVFDRQVTLRAA